VGRCAGSPVVETRFTSQQGGVQTPDSDNQRVTMRQCRRRTASVGQAPGRAISHAWAGGPVTEQSVPRCRPLQPCGHVAAGPEASNGRSMRRRCARNEPGSAARRPSIGFVACPPSTGSSMEGEFQPATRKDLEDWFRHGCTWPVSDGLVTARSASRDHGTARSSGRGSRATLPARCGRRGRRGQSGGCRGGS
jgi:hypothetical protein